MKNILIVTLIFPVIVVSLLVTTDTVFVRMEQLIPKRFWRVLALIFVYFVYVFCFASMSSLLLESSVFQYTLAVFLAFYYFKRYGKYLILLTPFLQGVIVNMTRLTFSRNFSYTLNKGILIFLLFVLVTKLPIKNKRCQFLLIYIPSMLISAGGRVTMIDFGFENRFSGYESYFFILIGAFVIESAFHYFFMRQELESSRIQQELTCGRRDQLTGAFNYRALHDRLLSLNGSSEQISLAMIDLDYFKEINDRYGHLAGNEVLKAFVEQLELHLQVALKKSRFEIYRFGGEEFCLVLYGLKKEDAFDILEGYRKKLEILPLILENQQEVMIHFSAGVQSNESSRFDLLTTLEEADLACYTAKQSGRNHIKLYQKPENT